MPHSQPPHGDLPPQAYPVSGGGGDAYPPTAQPVGHPVAQAQSAQPAQPIPVASLTQPQAYAAPQAPHTAGGQVARPIPVQPSGAALVREPTPEEQAEADAERVPDMVAAAPPWLVSLIVHVVLLMALALIFFTLPYDPPVEIVVDTTYAEEEGVQLDEEVLDFAPMDEIEFEEASLTPEDLVPVEDPFAAPPETDISIDATSSMSDLAAPTIGMALTGREPGMKKSLLAAYGGTVTTEAAVKEGLLWLKRNQKKDGSWSLRGPYKNGGGRENRNAATAMALLAFQGAGHTHKAGEHKDVVAKGWDWLLKQQAENGSFVPQGVPDNHQLYTHAQATIALCELYGMTKDPQYRDAAQKAVNFCVFAQAEEGGWRYHPKRQSDTSVTGWFVMALQSAMMAGLEVPSTTLANINEYLDSVQEEGGRLYRYRPNSTLNDAMSAEGLLCRQYLGWQQDDPRLVEGVARFVNDRPVDYGDQDVYYWYYATQAAHHMEGELWERWNGVMRQRVPAAQVKGGPESGSWKPGEGDVHAAGAGRLYTTCLSIYMLEVYYRHLPIYAEVYKFKLQQF